MPEYLSPGVYVEEVDRGPKPIEGVGTAMAAFVGFTEKADWVRVVDGENVTEDLLNKPQLITNWTQYVQKFGGFVEGAYMPHAVYGYFHNGGSRCYVLSVKTIGRAQAPLLGADGKAYLMVQAKSAGFDGLRLRVKVEVQELPAAKTPAKAKGKEAKEGEETTASAPLILGDSRTAGYQRWLANKRSCPGCKPGGSPGQWYQESPVCLQEQPAAGIHRSAGDRRGCSSCQGYAGCSRTIFES
jgi:phage tail sheath protein FI